MQSQTCFSTRFPRVLGGTQSSTTFQSIDKDTAGNIVVGGSTSDTTLATLFSTPDPILLYVQSGNTYLWGLNFGGNNFDGIGAVEFSTAGTYIFFGFTQIVPSKVLSIGVVQSSNAQLIRTLGLEGSFYKFHRIGQMLIDSADNLYIGYSEVSLASYKWYLQKISPIGTNPTISSYLNRLKDSDSNSEIGAKTLVFAPGNSGILISGTFSGSASTHWSIGFAYADASTGNVAYVYAGQVTEKFKRVTNLDVSTTSIVWGCGDFNLADLLIFSVPISSNSVPLPSAVTTGLWSAQNIQCLGITAYSSVDSYMIAASPTSSSDVRLIKASKIAGPSIQVSSYSFENTLSGASTNIVNGALFQKGQSKFYIVGTSKYFGGNLGQTFATDLGYIMEADYLMLGAQNQCLQLTLAFSSTTVLPSASILIWSSAYFDEDVRPGKSVSLDLTTSVQALKNLNLIDQSAWCGPQTSVTFTVSPFSTQTYDVGAAGQVSSITFLDFALSQTCTDAIYTYSAKISTTGAILPSFIVFNPTLKQFNWGTATAGNAGTYNIDVTGQLNNGQSQVWVFTLIINSINPCATAVISTSSIGSFPYQQNGSPYTLNITPFTSSASTVSCGAITYVMESPVGSATSEPQYVFNSTTMTLVINCNSCKPDGTLQTLKLIGTQGTVSNFIQFSVTFTSCSTASVIAPLSPTTLTIKVSDPMLTLPVNFFSSSVLGCEANLIYTCPQCSSSLIFTFTNPNLMIQALTSGALGTHQIKIYACFVLPPTIFHTITVTVNPDCSSPSGDFISNSTYDISESVQRVIATPVWDSGSSQCNSQISFVVMDLDTGLPADSQIIKLDKSPIQISVLPTKNSTKARLYQLSLQGSIGSSMTTVVFSLMITNLCPSAMPIPEIILDQKYTLGDPALIIEFPAWKDSLGSNKCGAITYSANANAKTLDPSWIKFDSIARKFSVQSSNILQTGIHAIKVFANLVSSGRLSMTQFQLTIIDPCATAQVIPSSMGSDLTYQATASNVHPQLQYSLNQWKDDKDGKCEPIVYKISGVPDSNLTGTFMLEIKPLDGIILLKLQGMIENPSKLEIVITGTLKNGNSSEIHFPITIIPDPILKQLSSSIFKIDPLFFNKNKTMKSDLKMRLKSIDTKGMIVIQFSKPLMQIGNLTIVEERKALSFMILGSGSPSSAKIVDWKIQEWGNNYIKIQLMIDGSDKISLGENQDQLKIVIREPQFFRSNDAGSIILVNSKSQIKFPPQQPNTTFAKTFDQVSGGTKSALLGTLGVNFIICLIFGASMSNMWQLLNIVQIMTILPILRIPYSSMFISTIDFLRTLAQFDILPNWLSFKYFRENILGVSSFDDFANFNPLILTNLNQSNSRLLQTFNETSDIALDDFGPKVSSVGIESTSIVTNLGSLGDMVIGMLLLSLVIQVFRIFFDCCSIFRSVYDFFAEILFFNTYIQASNQGYLYFSIVTLNSMSNLSSEKTFDRILTILMFVYIIVYPIFTLIYLIRVQPQIGTNEKIKINSGSFFELVHTNRGRGPIINIFIFLLRRIVLALAFFFLSDHQQAQVAIFMMSSFAILIYQCHFKPFITRQDTFFEFYNEATLLGISYCLFASLMFDKKQEYLDYTILGLILCAVVANFINFIYSSFRDLKQTCNKLGLKIKIFWNNLTKPKSCCCQSHNCENLNCLKNPDKPKKTVKIEPEISFSESAKEDTKEILDEELNNILRKARNVINEIRNLKKKKSTTKINQEIEDQIDDENIQNQQEEEKFESEAYYQKNQVKTSIKKMNQQKLQMILPKENEWDINELWKPQMPLKLSNQASTKAEKSEQQLSLSYLRNEDVHGFKISNSGLLQEIFNKSAQNDFQEKVLQNSIVQKETKNKLKFIHQALQKRKQNKDQ